MLKAEKDLIADRLQAGSMMKSRQRCSLGTSKFHTVVKIDTIDRSPLMTPVVAEHPYLRSILYPRIHLLAQKY